MTVARSVVQNGDNIITLSNRLLGSAERWRELITLNRLNPPYFAPTSAPGVLAPGDTILYPLGALSAPPTDTAELEARTYKRDLLLTGKDLTLAYRQLSTTVGLPNLKAALDRRLRVLVGAHPFHPEYGSLLRLHVGMVADDPLLELAVHDARRAILADPRVQSCSVQAEYASDVLSLRCDVEPIPPGTPFSFGVTL